MSVQRFVGANSREAMRRVRAALGDDALILANRRVAEGVEILALAEEMVPPAGPGPGSAVGEARPAGEAPDRPSGAHAGPASRPAGSSPAAAPPAVSRPAPSAPAEHTPPPDTAAPSPGDPRPGDPRPGDPNPGDPFAAFSERLLGEMQDLRALLVGRQEAAAPVGTAEDDNRVMLNRRLQGAGYGNALARELLDALPLELVHATAEAALAWLERQLVSRLAVLDDESRLLDEGGVFALLGPTGVGKTTTTAKLAARYVMRHGAGGVALVTTDSYRIGAHEQLRIYARLMGAEVHALDADAPLDDLLARLADKRLVIIDTVGMSQRDRRLVDQVAMLGQGARPVRRLLLLNAASHGETLEEVVETYQRASLAAGAPLYGAILTKVDEAPRLGAVLDIAIRHDLRLHYVSQGQQVPEDLRLVDPHGLVGQSLTPVDDSAFVGEPLAWQATPSARRWRGLSRSLLGQGRSLAVVMAQLRARVGGVAALDAAWPLQGLPLARQQAHLDRLRGLPAIGEEAAAVMLWSRHGPIKGSQCRLPALCLNARGLPLAAPWPSHCQPAGEAERLAAVETRLGVDRHFLPRCPSAAARRHLLDAGSDWLALAQANTRVIFEGERLALKALAEQAGVHDTLNCRYRGREGRLATGWLPVSLSDGTPLQAWFAVLRDPDTGRRRLTRYWLAADKAAASRPVLLVAHLVAEEWSSLASRAWQWLAPEAGEGVDTELRAWLASALAALAVRLDQETADWAMDVRGHLLALLGGSRKRSAAVLLEALWHLLAARDAFVLAAGPLLGGGDDAS
ncbi:flagellar biosynthesis protein FlhF [Modicisalibacter tunisiensis]|uniref:flagellar biosynthesis protein FlhF n=1 Tax=Modicisalibacter tunisiensis TaxID=390637 RepID=UPI001CCE65F9|nr:flagellar biosynthesis protein FlhF [Modicisalibacter tunisiensis]MBZ9538267.1 flagellar biosynthesis protein FlhF [Modicisalibacter tunisiensis]